MKFCPSCKGSKTLEEFYRSTATKDGRNSYCKACQRAYYLTHQERARSSTRLSNWRRYGINLTEDGYQQRLKEQVGQCAVCRQVRNYRLHVDHDHKTKKVRGLLCRNCNRAIGYLSDDVGVLRRAIKYLKEN